MWIMIETVPDCINNNKLLVWTLAYITNKRTRKILLVGAAVIVAVDVETILQKFFGWKFSVGLKFFFSILYLCLSLKLYIEK